MLTLSPNNKPPVYGIGAFNSLLIAISCSVLGGIFLFSTEGTEQTELEMAQYIAKNSATPSIRSQTTYNPFALASDTPAVLHKKPKNDWVISDERFELEYANRSILKDSIQPKNAVGTAGKNTPSAHVVKGVFDNLAPIKQALEAHFNRYQQWPRTLQSVKLGTLPKHINAIELSARGKLTLQLFEGSQVIDLSPKSSTKPLQWFCRTTLQNHLLGKGANRLCIHSTTLATAGKLQQD